VKLGNEVIISLESSKDDHMKDYAKILCKDDHYQIFKTSHHLELCSRLLNPPPWFGPEIFPYFPMTSWLWVKVTISRLVILSNYIYNAESDHHQIQTCMPMGHIKMTVIMKITHKDHSLWRSSCIRKCEMKISLCMRIIISYKQEFIGNLKTSPPTM
jgi:hypothetical protein